MGTLAAVAGAASVTTKTTNEICAVPRPQANAEGLRMTPMANYLARHILLESLFELAVEVELIKREVRTVLDKVLEVGDGDVAIESVRAAAGVREVHVKKLRMRAERGRVSYGPNLAVASVDEISESLATLARDHWLESRAA